MIFRQLFEPESSTYTYLIGCPETRQAVLIDPVLETIERDLRAVQEVGCQLGYTLETHIHADHVTSACRLRNFTGCKVCYPAPDHLDCADVGVSEDSPLIVGALNFKPLFTPGHTETHHCSLIEFGGLSIILTGDALLIDGCGRTDFQGGDPSVLYRSIHEKIFALPEDTLVFPAHDYNHRHVSTVAPEKERNTRLGCGKPLDEFIEIMNGLNLPYQSKIDIAVPANQQCGLCPDDEARRAGGKSVQG